MFTLFLEKRTREYHIVSQNSIEYPEYLMMEQQGYFKTLMTAKKRECERYKEELLEEVYA